MNRVRPDVPQTVRAIVVDTNTGSRGLPNWDQIDDLVDVINAQELQCQLWIPEPVLWEWAEHIHALAMATKATVESATRRLDSAGIEGFASVDYALGIDAVIERLKEQLEGYFLENGEEAVVVLELSDHPAAAIAGLRDQVLQLGAGRTKPGGAGAVKTGAADSSSWRLVAAHAPALADIVFVTADRDVERHFTGGAEPIVLKDIWAAKNALLRLQNGSDLAREAVIQAVRDDLPRLSEVALSRVQITGGLSRELIPRGDPTYDPTYRILGVEQVVELGDVEVSRSDETATAWAAVTLRIAVDYLRWDGDSETLESDVIEEYGVRGYAQVSAESDGQRSAEWSAWIDDVEFDG